MLVLTPIFQMGKLRKAKQIKQQNKSEKVQEYKPKLAGMLPQSTFQGLHWVSQLPRYSRVSLGTSPWRISSSNREYLLISMSPTFSNKQIKTQVFRTVCMENRKLWYVIISFPWHCWVKLLLLPNVSVTVSGSLLHERNCGHLNPHVLNVLSLETIMFIWNERNKNLHKLYTLKYTYCQTFQLIIEKPFSSLVMMHVAREILHLFYSCSDGCNADSCWGNLAGVQMKLGMYMFVT